MRVVKHLKQVKARYVDDDDQMWLVVLKGQVLSLLINPHSKNSSGYFHFPKLHCARGG